MEALILLTVAIAFGAEKAMRSSEKVFDSGVVTVDPEIQSIADRILNEAIRSERAKSGFAIVAERLEKRRLAVLDYRRNDHQL